MAFTAMKFVEIFPEHRNQIKKRAKFWVLLNPEI